jgi:threonine/homoserine/homoserine lactone efflux protein
MNSNFLIFISTVAIISLIPGLNVLLIISQSLKGGLRNSLSSIGGIVSGNTLYLLLSVAGTGVLLSEFPKGLLIVKLGGVLFTLYSAYTLIKASLTSEDSEATIDAKQKNFLQGFITIVSNPKAFIFWITVLPSFVDSGSHGFLLQVALFGLVAIAIDTTILLAYGSLAGLFASSANHRSKRIQYFISGLLLIGVAVWLALS